MSQSLISEWENVFAIRVVPRVGLEPTLPCGNEILSLARLPISPSRQRLDKNTIYNLSGFRMSGSEFKSKNVLFSKCVNLDGNF